MTRSQPTSPTPSQRWRSLALAAGAALTLAGALLAGLGQASTALARPLGVTYNVTSTANAGPGSLRQAIFSANASAGADAITFSLAGCPCVILLSNGLPTITDTLTITGPGADQLAVDGATSHRVFDIGGVPVNLTALTIQNGSAAGRGAGLRSSGNVTLTNVNVLSNTAQDDGGGVAVAGNLSLIGGRFEHNASDNAGGGLFVNGSLTFTDTVFITNTALGSGGSVYALEAVQGSGGRFERNQSVGGAGGGLYTSSTLWLTDPQFISNTAHAGGGGVYAYGAATLNSGLFSGNRSLTSQGGGFSAETGLTLTGTRFVSNTAEADGGAVYVQAAAQMVEGDFENNQSLDGDGGALYTELALALTNTQFISNATVGGYGGALYANDLTRIDGGRFGHYRHGLYQQYGHELRRGRLRQHYRAYRRIFRGQQQRRQRRRCGGRRLNDQRHGLYQQHSRERGRRRVHRGRP